MKRVVTLVPAWILLSCLFEVNAQHSDKELKKHQDKITKSATKKSAEVSLDTLFFHGKPWCLFKGRDKFMGTPMEVTIQDMNGTDIMWCRWIKGEEIQRPDLVSAYEITFAASGNKALYALVIGKNLEDELVARGLFRDGVFQPEAEARFLSMNPYKTGQSILNQTQQIRTQQSAGPVLVARNRNAMIQVFGDEIKQDFKTVGFVNETTELGQGKVFKVLNITLPDGTLVARAQSSDQGKTWDINTMHDHVGAQIQCAIGTYKKEIATFLIGRMYL